MAPPRLFALAAFTLLLVVPAAAAAGAPGIVTGVEATLTDLADGQNGDLWRIEYALTEDFAHGTGHLLTISLPEFGTGILRMMLFGSTVGWLPSSSIMMPGETVRSRPEVMILTILTITGALFAYIMRMAGANVMDCLLIPLSVFPY